MRQYKRNAAALRLGGGAKSVVGAVKSEGLVEGSSVVKGRGGRGGGGGN
jgi:hypothetical protein